MNPLLVSWRRSLTVTDVGVLATLLLAFENGEPPFTDYSPIKTTTRSAW
jgi:hypothetical protein